MPYNIFSGAGAAQDGLTEGADFVNKWMDRAAEKRAGYRAAPQIAQGNYRGAAEAYAGEGMAPEAQSMMHDQQAVDETTRQHGRQDVQDQDAAFKSAQDRYTLTMGVLGELRKTPEGQRTPALQSRLQLFHAVGFPPEFVQQLAGTDESHLTDAYLNTVGAQVQNDWKTHYGTRGDITQENERTGEIREKRAPYPVKARAGYRIDEDGNEVIDPEYVGLQGQIAEARAAANARHRAAPRGRSAGRGRAGNSGGNDAAIQAIEAELRRRGKL